MPRTCSICSRGDVAAINGLLLEGRSALSVAKDLGLSQDAVQRHAQKGHATIVTIPVVVKPEVADPLTELVTALRTKALGNSNDAAIVHQYRLALTAQQDAAKKTANVRDLTTDPEWLGIVDRMMKALEPYKEARLAVSKALA